MWWCLVKCLVRSKKVVPINVAIEGLLLLDSIGGRRAADNGLEISVHPFMPAVLLRLTGLGQPRANAQTHPPHRELGEPLDRVRRERRAVIRQDRLRQAKLAE